MRRLSFFEKTYSPITPQVKQREELSPAQWKIRLRYSDVVLGAAAYERSGDKIHDTLVNHLLPELLIVEVRGWM